jgi:phospholipid/cholesterol/gamma-HCH transport system ATP-binding protein
MMSIVPVISNRMILLVDGINYAEGTFNELSTSTDQSANFL